MSKLSLLCDFYEFTMAQGYFLEGKKDEICYFDVFFRKNPNLASFAIFAGLDDVLNFVENLKFDKEDIEFLRKQGDFREEFLEFLSSFKFRGEIYSMQEGEVIFPNEPLLCIKATSIEAQLLETFLLLSINHQSIIATKANLIVRAAKNTPVLEFGSRRAHGADAAIKGARAAFIGGCVGTACVLASKLFDIPVSGTMAHSWVQMFENELEAFRAYCKLYPKNAILLVDTYDTLKSGLPNAIKVFKEMKPLNFGIRIDSGNLYELSLKAREILDKAGLKDCKIIVSGSLDEKEILNLSSKNAPIDAFGVGEKLITSKSSPVLGCVYKLVAVEKNAFIEPKIKISESPEKTTIPHFKKLYRIYDKNTQKALYDQVCIYDEPLSLPSNLEAKELLRLVFKGKRLFKTPKLKELTSYNKIQMSKFDKNLLKKGFEVRLSPNLKELKDKLLAQAKENQ